MIYITGDCHHDFRKFNIEAFPEQREMTKDDYVIICDDFGGVWMRDEESTEEKWWLDGLEERSFTTLFVDGNHENFDRLYSYPVEEWNGGKVHKIRPSVIHLMRGQVFEMDDPELKKKRRVLDAMGVPYRINHLSWWKEELPSEEEMDEGRRNLSLHDFKVDFIVSHCCSSSTQTLLGRQYYKRDYLNEYFEEIKDKTEFKKWFFGHYHDNANIGPREILIYER